MMKIKPDLNCEFCHGTGEITDWVDYGSTVAPLTSYCSCVEDQIPEFYDGEIELDLDEYYSVIGDQ